MKGKFIIKDNKKGMFYFELALPNGIRLVRSEYYSSKKGIENAILNVRKYAIDAEVVYETPLK